MDLVVAALTGTNSLELSDEEMSSSDFFDDIQFTDTDDELEPFRIRGGNMERRYQEAHNILVRQYFADVPDYSSDDLFRRRFRMSKALFKRLFGAVKRHDRFFQVSRCFKFDMFLQDLPDAAGRLGPSGLLKFLSALKMLAEDRAADSVDDQYSCSESTAMKAMKRLCETVVQLFGGEYLRSPTEADLRRILEHNQRRGWPG